MTAQRTITADDYRSRASEHILQVQVLEVIAYKGKRTFAFAIPNAGNRGLATAARMKAEGLTAGVADLCVMLQGGRVGWLEIKTAKGKQSNSQKGFAAVCAELGHPYALVRSLNEAISVLREWGALK